MGQVTALTAEKTLALSMDNVIGGHLDGDILMLDLRNGESVPAGNVRGPTGLTGGLTEGQVDDRITLKEDRSGRGIMARDKDSVDDALGSVMTTWYNMANISKVFTPVLNRCYEIKYYAYLRSVTDLCSFDVELLAGGAPLQRVTAFAPNGGRGIGVQGIYEFKATAPEAVSTTYTMRARFTVNGAVVVENSYAPCTLSIVDVGVI